MSIIENISGITEALSGTTWINKWLKYLAIIAPIIVSLGLPGCGGGHAQTKLPATEVLVARPVQEDVPIQSQWVATLDGYVNAEIRPQVSGYIVSHS
jgi:hypothetical protein